MTKKTNKNQSRNAKNAFIVKEVARIHGVTEGHVYKVLAGNKENEEIFNTYMDMLEGTNALVKEVKKLIPFN